MNFIVDNKEYIIEFKYITGQDLIKENTFMKLFLVVYK